MISDHRHTAIVDGYAAFNRGDLQGALQHLHHEVEWIEPDEFEAGGTYRGHAGVVDYLGRSRQRWDFIESTPEKLVDIGADDVVVVVRTRGGTHNPRKDFDRLIADVYTFDQAKVVRMRAFADPIEAFLAFGVAPGT